MDLQNLQNNDDGLWLVIINNCVIERFANRYSAEEYMIKRPVPGISLRYPQTQLFMFMQDIWLQMDQSQKCQWMTFAGQHFHKYENEYCTPSPAPSLEYESEFMKMNRIRSISLDPNSRCFTPIPSPSPSTSPSPSLAPSSNTNFNDDPSPQNYLNAASTSTKTEENIEKEDNIVNWKNPPLCGNCSNNCKQLPDFNDGRHKFYFTCGKQMCNKAHKRAFCGICKELPTTPIIPKNSKPMGLFNMCNNCWYEYCNL